MRTGKIIKLVLILSICLSCESGSDLSSGGATGQGGSMTRFAISGNFMYVLDKDAITVFSIANASFTQTNSVPVGNGMETIFAKGDFLYLGANDGMYIYSITNPDAPSFVFRYVHIVACDPVVVQGNRAYVTLRNGVGTTCFRGVNLLEIIDITDPYNPRLVSSYPAVNPHGLAVEGKQLFLCEGDAGLRVFNIENELDIELIDEVKDIHAYDVIARGGVLTVTGQDGIFQYQYHAGSDDLIVLGAIPVARTDV